VDLAARLAAPSRVLALADLAAEWASARISLRVAGAGALAGDMELGRRLRGALGRELMAAASNEALAGRPCPWQPPCALDVLFREQGRMRGMALAKPWVLRLDRRGADLEIAVLLFGYAMDWSAAVAQALVAAARGRIAWPQRAGVPVGTISRLRVVEQRGVAVPAPGALTLEFLTPMNAESLDPRERPDTVLSRLMRRVEALAPWQDAAVAEDWRDLAALWLELEWDVSGLRGGAADRRSGRAGREFRVPVVTGWLGLARVPPPLCALLGLGSETHVGKGATEGFGRLQPRAEGKFCLDNSDSHVILDS